MTPVLLENGAKESGSNSAKGWATQIARSVFEKNDGTKANLLTNKVTRDVYAPALKCIWLNPKVIESPDAREILIRSIIHEVQHAIQYIEGFAKGSSGVYWERMVEMGNPPRYSDGTEMVPKDAYRNTAGEIEAYDVSRRYQLDDDERKNIRPDIDRKDVVFSYEEVEKLAPLSRNHVQYAISSDHNYVYTDGKACSCEVFKRRKRAA